MCTLEMQLTPQIKGQCKVSTFWHNQKEATSDIKVSMTNINYTSINVIKKELIRKPYRKSKM